MSDPTQQHKCPHALCVRKSRRTCLSWILWSPLTPSDFYYYFNKAQIRNSKQENHSGQSVINRNLIILLNHESHAPNHFHSPVHERVDDTRHLPGWWWFCRVGLWSTFVADTRNSINTRTLILGTFLLFVFSLSLSLTKFRSLIRNWVIF